MKYLALMATLAAIYFIFLKASPVNSVKEAVKQTEITPLVTGGRAPTPAPAVAATSGNKSGLRAPIDRTHSALDAVRARNGGGDF